MCRFWLGVLAAYGVSALVLGVAMWCWPKQDDVKALAKKNRSKLVWLYPK